VPWRSQRHASGCNVAVTANLPRIRPISTTLLRAGAGRIDNQQPTSPTAPLPPACHTTACTYHYLPPACTYHSHRLFDTAAFTRLPLPSPTRLPASSRRATASKLPAWHTCDATTYAARLPCTRASYYRRRPATLPTFLDPPPHHSLYNTASPRSHPVPAYTAGRRTGRAALLGHL